MRLLFTFISLAGFSLFAPAVFGQDPSTPPTVPPPVTITVTPPAATVKTPTAASSPATASIATKAAPASNSAAAPPTPPPDSVPDAVNPFADEHNLPKPLPTINISCASLNAEVRTIPFDGIPVLTFFVNGPDFQWQFDPLTDWILAPKGFDESFALVYAKDPAARLSFCLYSGKDFLPDVTPASIIQYLAAVREDDPKGFILTTPITKDMPSLPANHFAGFSGQGVTYATTSPMLVLHHDWFLDLNGQYQLVVKLACPPALLGRLEPQIGFVFDRGATRRGLGVNEPAPAPAKSDSTVKTATSD